MSNRDAEKDINPALIALIFGGGSQHAAAQPGRIPTAHRVRQHSKLNYGKIERDFTKAEKSAARAELGKLDSFKYPARGGYHALKVATSLTVGLAASEAAAAGFMAFIERRAGGILMNKNNSGEALSAAGEAVKATLPGALKETALSFIPGYTSVQDWRAGNYLSAIGWGAVDAVGVASLILPGIGEAAEGAIISAKAARAARIAATAARGLEKFDRIATTANRGYMLYTASTAAYSAARFGYDYRHTIRAGARLALHDLRGQTNAADVKEVFEAVKKDAGAKFGNKAGSMAALLMPHHPAPFM